jgi:hypothetical protein
MSQEQSPRPSRQPEKKIGPFAGGIGVAIWVNAAETPEGPRVFRSITISPRRYLDRESGEWKDASSYNPGDLPALIYALTKAQEYVFETPLPDQKSEDPPKQQEDIPF